MLIVRAAESLLLIGACTLAFLRLTLSKSNHVPDGTSLLFDALLQLFHVLLLLVKASADLLRLTDLLDERIALRPNELTKGSSLHDLVTYSVLHLFVFLTSSWLHSSMSLHLHCGAVVNCSNIWLDGFGVVAAAFGFALPAN